MNCLKKQGKIRVPLWAVQPTDRFDEFDLTNRKKINTTPDNQSTKWEKHSQFVPTGNT